MSIVSDETLEGIRDALKERNVYLSKIARKTVEGWEDVRSIVQAGLAPYVFSIGDVFETSYTVGSTVYTNPFVVTHFGNVELEDGSTVPGMYIQQQYATIEAIQFDAPEPNNSDDNIKQYGYNRWSESGLRSWLNSSASAGSWFGDSFERNGQTVARRAADVAPAQHNSYSGYLSRLDSDLVDILQPVKIATCCNTVTDGGATDYTFDKIFIPSIEQMYGSPQVVGAEGGYWEYWKNKTGFNVPKNDPVDGRKIYALENRTSVQSCRIRSAVRGYSFATWIVANSGTLSYYYGALAAARCAPACVIC